jgi:hypothetical protein
MSDANTFMLMQLLLGGASAPAVNLRPPVMPSADTSVAALKVDTSSSAAAVSSVRAPSSSMTPKTVASSYDDDEEDDTLMPWEEEDFIPKMTSGKQKHDSQRVAALHRCVWTHENIGHD